MSDVNSELLALFQEEANEYLDALTSGLLDLEVSDGDDARGGLLREISRVAHSLKGAARTVNMRGIEKVAHHMETVFDANMQGSLTISAEVADVLYDGLDVIRALMDGVSDDEIQDQIISVVTRLEHIGSPEPPTQTPASPAPAQTGAQPEAGIPEAVERPSVGELIGEPVRLLPIGPSPLDTKPLDPKVVEDEADSGPRVRRRGVLDQHFETATIRVAITKLDALMAQAGELLVSNISLQQRLAELRDLSEEHARWRKAWRKARPAFTRLKRNQELKDAHTGPGGEHLQHDEDLNSLLSFFDMTQRYAREMAAHLATLDQAMNQDHMQLSMVAGDLQDGVRRVRMLPFETILGGFQRMVRDLSRQHNKEIIFNVIGEQVELDKRVLEAIKSPIMHLLRNAVDHGLEAPEERQASGKDPAGYLTLMVAQKGAEIMVTVGDDGRGIAPERVKRAAVRSGRLGPNDADLMDDQEAINLIFLPGLSTKEEVTTTSGRGIGMDVVRQNVEGLRGHVTVQSRRGLGTAIQLVVPVSLTTMHCMLTRVGREIYAIPVYSIERIVEITPEECHTVKGRQVIKLENRPVTLVRLTDVLERPRLDDAEKKPDEMQLALILRSGDKMAAFVVDELLAELELVVKNLGHEMARVRNVAGVTLLGTGQVVVILNPSDLLKSAQAATRRHVVPVGDLTEQVGPKACILVVDDSITTRTLEKNILEAAGYQVITATDGQEALELVTHSACDLIISDIEMPRMDGLVLTETIKSDEKLKHLPLVLVTSREAPADRDRGMQAGADAYIVKGDFDQDELLETIGQLL
ncbi:MAG: hybrid sensor histidine kinase/response regulator [Anaerolineae bacterium]|nr:hybrid sensor histidine kinase/response regulator [Anaerolineae bacterium]